MESRETRRDARVTETRPGFAPSNIVDPRCGCRRSAFCFRDNSGLNIEYEREIMVRDASASLIASFDASRLKVNVNVKTQQTV